MSLFKKIRVVGASDASALHLGIAMDVGVGELASTGEENLHSQQEHRPQKQKNREQ